MNKWVAMGRLCEDPKITKPTSETTVAKFSLAVDRKYDREKADFFPCVAFEKLAEFCGNYLKKGSKIAVIGEPQNNNYTDKNGNKVYAWNFVLNEIDFAESKTKGTNSEGARSDQNNDFLNVPDGLVEELPFS